MVDQHKNNPKRVAEHYWPDGAFVFLLPAPRDGGADMFHMYPLDTPEDWKVEAAAKKAAVISAFLEKVMARRIQRYWRKVRAAVRVAASLSSYGDHASPTRARAPISLDTIQEGTAPAPS